jgi:hypothetical protein
MTEIEKKVFLKLIKDMNEMKENIKYLVEAIGLLVEIETESVKKGKR